MEAVSVRDSMILTLPSDKFLIKAEREDDLKSKKKKRRMEILCKK